jgi:hypothetical protein
MKVGIGIFPNSNITIIRSCHTFGGSRPNKEQSLAKKTAMTFSRRACALLHPSGLINA